MASQIVPRRGIQIEQRTSEPVRRHDQLVEQAPTAGNIRLVVRCGNA